MDKLYVRVLGRCLTDDPAPKPGRIQHVGFVHRRDAAPALPGQPERHMGDAVDLMLAIGHHVRRGLFAVPGLCGMAPEIDSADQFPHHEEVNALGGDILP